MNDILNCEEYKFEKFIMSFCLKHSVWWCEDDVQRNILDNPEAIKDILSFLSASNKRVALEVLGRVKKGLPKESEVYHLPDYDPIRLRNIGRNEALAAVKKIIDDEKERWK